MRVPSNRGRKNRKTISLSPVLFSSVIIFLSFSIVFYCAVSPAAGGDNEKLSIILIDGDEVYVRSGDYYTFLQGYQIYVKGTNTESDRVWIELCRDNVFLEDAIVGEGDTFVYSSNSTEILNLTVETIYGGASGVLVKFSPVYQYLDPKLPMPQTNQSSPASNSTDNQSSIPPELGRQAEGFDVPVFLLSIGAVFFATGIFAGVYKKK
jgi:hypothetical protein